MRKVLYVLLPIFICFTMQAMQQKHTQAQLIPVLVGDEQLEVEPPVLNMFATLRDMRESCGKDPAPIPLESRIDVGTFDTMLSCVRASLSEEISYGQRVTDIVKILQKNCPTKEQANNILHALDFLQAKIKSSLGAAFVLYYAVINPKIERHLGKSYTELPNHLQRTLESGAYSLFRTMRQYTMGRLEELPPLAREALTDKDMKTILPTKISLADRKTRDRVAVNCLLRKYREDWRCINCSPNVIKYSELSFREDGLDSLSPEIGSLLGLQTLILSRNLLSSLPPTIGDLAHLNKLVAWNNCLQALPPEIGNLFNLQYLDLGHNQLRSLPPQIGGLVSLKTLDLSSNKLSSLPSTISGWTSLRELRLTSNKLTSLPPEIGRLVSLEMLWLVDNPIASIPPELGELSTLKTLTLFCNQLTSLPTTIGGLVRLEKLCLAYNKLTSLPAEIGALSNLREFTISGNYLVSIPHTIGHLHRLLELRLFSNRLASVPPEIGALAGLQTLNLWGNNLTSLPDEIGGLTDLRELDLDRNKLTSLPPAIGRMTRLSRLWLAYNQLGSLPSAIAYLPSLSRLSLVDNRLGDSEISSLRKAFRNRKCSIYADSQRTTDEKGG